MVGLIQTAFRSHISLMVAKVYIPFLFPLTFLIAVSAIKVDALLGMEKGFLPSPTNLIVAAVFLVYLEVCLYFLLNF